MLTLAEENHLKAILSISLINPKKITTNAIAKEISISPASVSDMLKKLLEKKLIKYEKYQGVSLSKKGLTLATNILRKHRLWECFLVNKLKFDWSEVHDIAEQLEHIRSVKLIDKLDSYLNFPKYDPHGEPIPSKNGEFPKNKYTPLNKLCAGEKGQVMGVTIDEKSFLDYLTKLNINIGTNLHVLDIIIFDNSINVLIDEERTHISNDVAKHLLINKL